MQKYGLLGRVLGHSFSARYFSQKFVELGINASYCNFEYPTIDSAMDAISRMENLIGFNVTIPYKKEIFPYLSGVTPEAAEIGAVNVVYVDKAPDGSHRYYGTNSDTVGFTGSIRPLLQRGSHSRALVLGSGGASKAIVYSLRHLGIEPTLVSRTPALNCLTYTDLTPEVMASHTAIINCTPVGMSPHENTCPQIPYELLTPDHLVYDLIYNPLETRLMSLASQRGATVKNGLEMLHLQAESSWEFWQNMIRLKL